METIKLFATNNNNNKHMWKVSQFKESDCICTAEIAGGTKTPDVWETLIWPLEVPTV